MAKPPPKLNRDNIPGHFFSKWVPDTRPTLTKPCDHPGCSGVGEYRAPARHYRDEVKAGPLNIIDEKREQVNRWFCLDHVKQYNAQWDYYEGLDQGEMEEAIRFDGVWNRPTWRFGQWGPKAGRDRSRPRPKAQESAPRDEEVTEPSATVMMEAGRAALTELGLEPPVEFFEIKKRYRELVKKHHPDMQQDEVKGEGADIIQRINAAFTLLKGIYQRKKV